MILAPNFSDHWKTDLLVKLSGSEESVRGLLRFWAHCQQQKTDRFTNLTPSILAAICRWRGDENRFWEAMSKTFMEIKENGVCVAHDWKQANSQLVTSWKNGGLGGRPPKNPRDTRGIPVDNPRQTPGKPNPLSNPSNPSPPSGGHGGNGKQSASGLAYALEKKREATERQIADVKLQGVEDAFGLKFENHQHGKLFRKLTSDLKEIDKQLAAIPT